MAAPSSHCSPVWTTPSPHLATVVVALAVLLERTGSNWSPETVAVFVIDPAVAGAVTTMVIELLAPTASAGNEQFTVRPEGTHTQPVPVALTRATPAGSVSVTLMLVAGLGPRLLTFKV